MSYSCDYCDASFGMHLQWQGTAMVASMCEQHMRESHPLLTRGITFFGSEPTMEQIKSMIPSLLYLPLGLAEYEETIEAFFEKKASTIQERRNALAARRRNVDGSPDMRCAENRTMIGGHTSPARAVTPPASSRPSPSALELAEQLEARILAEAKKRVDKEKAEEEARILAEAQRRLEAERAAAAARRWDDVETRIQAAMAALRSQ